MVFPKEYKRLAINVFLIAIGTIGSRSIAFFLLPLFTRYMIPSEYGKLDIINTTISLFVPILSFQIIEAVFRFTVSANEDQRKKDVFSNAIFFSLLSFLLSICLYPFLKGVKIFSEYNTYFYAIFFLNVLSRISKHFVRGLGKIRIYAASDILYSGIFASSNVILLVLMKLGIKAFLISNIIALSGTAIFLFLSARLTKYLTLRFNKKMLKEMLSYSTPLIPSDIMWWIVNASDRYFLSYFIGYEATGIYSVASRFPSLLTVFYGIFFQAWQLSAIEEFGKKDYGRFFKNVFGMVSSVMFLGSSVLFLFIKPFMRVYVGATYFESWKYTAFLFLGAVFNTFASFYGVNYIASKRTAGAFSTSVIAATTKVALVLALIKILGIQAASISTFLAYLVMWLVRIFHTRKIVKAELDEKHVVISSATVFAQAVLLLMIENTVLLYILQAVLLTILLWSQRKYGSKAVRFGRSFVESKANK